MPTNTVDRLRTMTTLETQRYLGTIVNHHGRPICRRTLDKWLTLGLPSHQPSGRKGKRFFVVAEVDAWLAHRCSSNTPATEVAA